MVRWILATLMLISLCIGSGFIAQTYILSLIGLWPSFVALLFVWTYLLVTSFYYLEATLANPPGVNLFTITKRFVGGSVAWVASGILFLSHLILMVAVFYFCPILIADGVKELMGIVISVDLLRLLMMLIIGTIVFLGLQTSLIVNAIFTLGLAAIFVEVFSLSEEPQRIFDEKHKWGFFIITVPTLINGLFYHTIIPTLSAYLQFNKRSIQSSIAVGLTVVIALYTTWQVWLAVSVSSISLDALSKVHPESFTFLALSSLPLVGKQLPYLFGFGMLAALLSMGIILNDFLSDLFAIPLEKRVGYKRLLICLSIFIPSYLLSLISVNEFYTTILSTTEIGGLFLSGLLPVLWIWRLRYHDTESASTHRGSKITLVIMSLLTFYVFYLFGLQLIYQTS